MTLSWPSFPDLSVALPECRRVWEGCMTTKMMPVAAIMGGLLPIMWTTGTGADSRRLQSKLIA